MAFGFLSERKALVSRGLSGGTSLNAKIDANFDFDLLQIKELSFVTFDAGLNAFVNAGFGGVYIEGHGTRAQLNGHGSMQFAGQTTGEAAFFESTAIGAGLNVGTSTHLRFALVEGPVKVVSFRLNLDAGLNLSFGQISTKMWGQAGNFQISGPGGSAGIFFA